MLSNLAFMKLLFAINEVIDSFLRISIRRESSRNRARSRSGEALIAEGQSFDKNALT
jgi:hypothetical protein